MTIKLEGQRVLVIEDEVLLAIDMVDELDCLGATPLGPCASVEEALLFLRENEQVDAALLNVQLRGALSFPVVEALRERAIPFIFVTGNDDVVREHFPDVPVHPKPADMWKIVASLATMLRSPSVSPEAPRSSADRVP